MIRKLRYCYTVADLYYQPQSLELFQKFKHPTQDNLGGLLNFSLKSEEKPIYKRFFLPKTHQELLQLYLNLIQEDQKDKNNQNYRFIEQNLMNFVINRKKSQHFRLKDYKLNVIESRMLEKYQFRGLFLHRKFNLPYDCYDFQIKRQGFTDCKMKLFQKQSAIRLYQKIIRRYQQLNMKNLYGYQFKQQMQEKIINRYVYLMDINFSGILVKHDTKLENKIENSTQHILQIESFYNSVSNLEEFYLTDVDYILKGNPYFRQKLIF